MCLAIPMEIIAIKENNMATVSANGATRDIALDLVPSANVGDYALVHAGFAIEIVDAEYARQTLELIEEMAELVDDPLFNPAYAEEVCTVPGAQPSAADFGTTQQVGFGVAQQVGFSVPQETAAGSLEA